MVRWVIPPARGLVEPSIAPEFYVNGLGAVELIGSQARAYYTLDQLPLESGSTVAQKVVTVKLIWPIAVLPLIIGKWGQSIAAMCEPEESPHDDGPWPRLVK